MLPPQPGVQGQGTEADRSVVAATRPGPSISSGEGRCSGLAQDSEIQSKYRTGGQELALGSKIQVPGPDLPLCVLGCVRPASSGLVSISTK